MVGQFTVTDFVYSPWSPLLTLSDEWIGVWRGEKVEGEGRDEGGGTGTCMENK